MRTFDKFAAQGEVNIEIVDKLPAGLEEVKIKEAVHIIGHSESGHHHVLDRPKVTVYKGGTTPSGMQILYALVKEPTELRHTGDGSGDHQNVGFNAGDIVKFTPSVDFDPYEEKIRQARD